MTMHNEDYSRCQRRSVSVHTVGCVVFVLVLMAMIDEALTMDSDLVELGLGLQSRLLVWALPICALVCVTLILAPLFVSKPRRGIGMFIRMPASVRYAVAIITFVGLMLAVEYILFWPVASLDIPNSIPDARRTAIADAIARETRPNVVSHDNRILFLEEKRASVENALERQNIPKTGPSSFH